MALSTCYITSPNDLELVVLNPNCEATYSAFSNLPHTDDTVYESLNGCIEKLHNVQYEVNERNSLLKVNRVDNIDQYNKSISNNNLNQAGMMKQEGQMGEPPEKPNGDNGQEPPAKPDGDTGSQPPSMLENSNNINN